MKIGDIVTWVSSNTEKTGEVIAVIPARTRPTRTWPTPTSDLYLSRLLGKDWHRRYNAKALGGGSQRSHESYLVTVKTGKTDRAKLSIYWPVVKWLRKAEQ